MDMLLGMIAPVAPEAQVPPGTRRRQRPSNSDSLATKRGELQDARARAFTLALAATATDPQAHYNPPQRAVAANAAFGGILASPERHVVGTFGVSISRGVDRINQLREAAVEFRSINEQALTALLGL
jgi:hypothetical protein